MKLKRSDLRRMLKPIVREFVEEAIEELISENYINNTIQESVLKGDVIGHVISEVFRGMNTSSAPLVRNPESSRRISEPQNLEESQGDFNPDRDPTLQRIKELAHNPELEQTLQRTRNAYDQMDQKLDEQYQPPSPKQFEPVEARGVNWTSVASAIPPDDPRVGLQAPVQGTLSEVNQHLNPLNGTVGAGIDINIVKELNPKSIWGKDKLKRFLNMGPQEIKSWQKRELNVSTNKQINTTA